MSRSLTMRTFPSVLAVLALGMCVYQYVEIRRMHVRIAQVAEAPVNARDCRAAIEVRLRALELRATRVSSTSLAAPGAVAESEHEELAPDGSAGPSAAQRGLPRALPDQVLVHETTRKL